MTNENNTDTADTATISEKELWAAFLPLTITKSVTVSPFNDLTVENFVPAHLVTDYGNYGSTEDLADRLADELADSEDPDEALGCWIEDLENYVNGLKVVQENFRALKRMALVMPPEPEPDLWKTDPVAYKAWEQAANRAEENPRYRPLVEKQPDLGEMDESVFWTNDTLDEEEAA